MSKLLESPIDLLSLKQRKAAALPVKATVDVAVSGISTEADVMLRNAQVLAADPDSVILSVDQIEVRDQVRERFEPVSLDELAADIAEHGQHQPVVVTHLKGSRYLLEAGERRLRAIRDLLKRDEIRATIRRPHDNEATYTRKLVQLSENEQRENLTKLEVARVIVKLQKMTGWTDTEVAERMHRSRTWVVRVRSILEAPKSVQVAIENGQISWHAWATDRHAVLSAAEAIGADATGTTALSDAYRAPVTDQEAVKKGAGEERIPPESDREPTVPLPLSTAQAILRTLQKLAATHNVEIEVPKKPARKQLAELLAACNKKIARVV